MAYPKRAWNWIRGLSLEALLIATLALPALLLVAIEATHAQAPVAGATGSPSPSTARASNKQRTLSCTLQEGTTK
jgi:invasion protein IalB